jgi:hypothetical protein
MVISFSVTVLLLAGIALGLSLSRPSVPVMHLPQTLPTYSATWARYVPSNSVLFGFENYTLIRQYNASYPFYGTLLTLPDVRLDLPSRLIDSVLTIVLETPNATVDIAFVSPRTFANFSETFARYGFAAVQQGQNTMYYVRDLTKGTLQFGWIALAPSDDAIAFSLGSEVAKEAIQEVLGVQQGSVSSVIDRQDVRGMLYVVNGTSGHLALGLQNFPGVVRSGVATFTVVNAVGPQLEVSRVVEFNSTSVALAQWTLVRSAYLSATKFVVFDTLVQATEFHPLSKVAEYVRLVE